MGPALGIDWDLKETKDRFSNRQWQDSPIFSQSASSMAELGDKVCVRILRAHDLPASTSGLGDVFAQLQLGDFTTRTRTANDPVNPVWEDDFTFDVTDPYMVLVMRHESWDPKDYAGACKFAMRDIPFGEASAVQLRDSQGIASGKVVLKVDKLQVQAPEREMSGVIAPDEPVAQEFQPVVLHVIDADDLNGGLPCKPYVVLHVGDIMKRSSVCSNHGRAVWDEDFELTMHPSDSMQVLVKDGARGDTVLGSGVLSGKTALSRRGGAEFWMILEDAQMQEAGKLRLATREPGAPRIVPPRPAVHTNAEQASKISSTSERSRIFIKVINAEHLTDFDPQQGVQRVHRPNVFVECT